MSFFFQNLIISLINYLFCYCMQFILLIMGYCRPSRCSVFYSCICTKTGLKSINLGVEKSLLYKLLGVSYLTRTLVNRVTQLPFLQWTATISSPLRLRNDIPVVIWMEKVECFLLNFRWLMTVDILQCHLLNVRKGFLDVVLKIVRNSTSPKRWILLNKSSRCLVEFEFYFN